MYYTTLHYNLIFVLNFTTLLYIVLNFFILYCTTLHYTGIFYIELHYLTLYCTTLHCTTLHCTALLYTVLPYTVLHYFTLYCTALLYNLLHFFLLYCTTLHCTSLLYPVLGFYGDSHFKWTLSDKRSITKFWSCLDCGLFSAVWIVNCLQLLRLLVLTTSILMSWSMGRLGEFVRPAP